MTDLMESIPNLVPLIIPLKDLLSVAADIEDRIKGSNTKIGKSNDELLIDFLNGGTLLGPLPDAPLPILPAPLTTSAPLDNPAILASDEREDPRASGPLHPPATQPPTPPSLSPSNEQPAELGQ